MKFMAARHMQTVFVEGTGMLGPTDENPHFRYSCKMRGVKTTDRATADDADALHLGVSPAIAPQDILARGAAMFDSDHPGKLALACALHRAKYGIACIVRVLDDDSTGIKSVLQSRANRVNRSSTPFPHALGAVECKRRRRFHVAIKQVRHIHRGDWRVIAECRGQ